MSSFVPQIISVLNGAKGAYTWAWQELDKGRSSANWFLGSDHGGWRFSGSTNYSNPTLVTDSEGVPSFNWDTWPPAQTASITDAQLRTNAFFQMTSTAYAADATLYGTSGSQYAQTYRNRILADAIPCRTLPVGANPVPRLTRVNEDDKNIDMKTELENGWPQSRFSTTEGNKWHHGDYVSVAYTFTYKLFDDFVNFGNLK
jgi:hypothetical protein